MDSVNMVPVVSLSLFLSLSLSLCVDRIDNVCKQPEQNIFSKGSALISAYNSRSLSPVTHMELELFQNHK